MCGNARFSSILKAFFPLLFFFLTSRTVSARGKSMEIAWRWQFCIALTLTFQKIKLSFYLSFFFSFYLYNCLFTRVIYSVKLAKIVKKCFPIDGGEVNLFFQTRFSFLERIFFNAGQRVFIRFSRFHPCFIKKCFYREFSNCLLVKFLFKKYIKVK